MSTPNTVWSDPADLVAAPPADEFAPDVAAAIAELRARGGFSSPDCPEARDAERRALHELLPGVNRRGFLQLTGAAAVFAMASGCAAQHPDTLVPYAQQPEGATLGEGMWYSTVVRVNGRAHPVMARTYDGRPIKLDGNPDHPVVRGASDAQTQAALLDLYDPDRGGVDPERPGVHADGPRRRDGGGMSPCTWPELDAAVGAALGKAGRILLVTGPVDGPARRAHLAALVRAFGARLTHVAYHPWAEDSAVEARRLVLGAASAPHWQPSKARLVLSLGSDLLASGGLAVQVGYGQFRRPLSGGDEPGQVIAFEPTLGQLGSCADVRVRVSMDRLPWVAWGIAAEVAAALGASLPPAIAAALPRHLPEVAAQLRAVPGANGATPAIAFAAGRLLAVHRAGHRSLVHVGGAVHSGPESLGLHIAATWLNRLLGNEGISVVGKAPPSTRSGLSAALATKPDAVIVAGGANPAFDLPGAAEALAGVPLVVSLNPSADETTALAHWHAPGLHDLESWGDASSAPGIAELQQPVVQPLWDARAAEDSLSAFAVAAVGDAAAELRTARAAVAAQPAQSVVSRKQVWNAAERGVLPWSAFVRRHWTAEVQRLSGAAAAGDAFWSAALSRGFAEIPAEMIAEGTPGEIPAPAPPGGSGLMLICSAARTVGDGGQLNNAWLQELPDPVSKVCWDGWAGFSPADARELGIATHDVVELAVAGATVRLPALVQDGQHPGAVEVFLGWGRSRAGLVAAITAEDGHRANAYLLAGGRRWGAPVAVTRTGARYELAMTQHHHRLAGERIAVEDVLELHRRDPGGVRRERRHHAWEQGTDGEPGGRLSIWRRHQSYPGHRWGMAIDLDLCTGCNACMVACSAENNVPVVGRDEVRKNREMHWMRLDRYYSAPAGEADARLDVAVIHQPMLCQQCDHAPCEAVCPANATMKSDEGVNLQVYNRCIGTRYCSNNCPYKVRRFNWYQYTSFRAGPHRSGEPLGRLAANVATGGNHIAPAELAHQPLHLLLNPEVTVRHRGVMEKCNFCVQRQRAWRNEERRQHRRLGDGHLTSACAQACPTRAITWGDLNDPAAAVVSASADARAYLALDAEMNTRPKVAYLRKLRHRPATGEDLDALAPAPAPEGHP